MARQSTRRTAVRKPASNESARRPFVAAEKTAEFFDSLRAHYRKMKRRPVEIACRVRLLVDDKLWDEGAGTVKDLSPSGALLTKLATKRDVLPIGPFRVRLELEGLDYDGIFLEGSPVRLVPEDRGIALTFTEVGCDTE